MLTFILTKVDFLAAGNHLTGSIPPEIGKLTELRNFVVGKNELSGTLPTELGSCSSLEIISLLQNAITGTVPIELKNIPNLGTANMDQKHQKLLMYFDLPCCLLFILGFADQLILSENYFTGAISKEQCKRVSILEVDCIYLLCPCEENCRCTPV